VNLPNERGPPPLCIAAQNDDLEVVKAFASLGAKVNVPLGEGVTPALVAVRMCHSERLEG
jgi:ankyrin repeat protein